MPVWCKRVHRVGREERGPELRACTPTRRGLPGIGLRSAPSESIPATVSSAGTKKYAVRKKLLFSDILPRVHRSHLADHGYPGAARFARIQPRNHRLIPFWSHRWALLQQMATASPTTLLACVHVHLIDISASSTAMCVAIADSSAALRDRDREAR